jgi:transcriptional regulator with XRE-family HTH domain
MKIKRYREQSGLSQQALSKKAGLSREYLARLESGQHNPSLVTLQKLAKALGVPVTELLG